MKAIIRNLLRKFGYDLVGFKHVAGRPNPLRPWEEDPECLRVCQSVVPHTLVDRLRLYMLYQLARKSSRLGGDMAECGVYRGGTALLLCQCKSPDRTLFLFDTFEGMPDVDATQDIHRAGDLADTSLAKVQQLLAGQPAVVFRQGRFPETAAGLEDRRFCFVHVDVDIYQSVLDCCNFFEPRLVPGGVIVFDDYGFLSTPGAKAAVEEYCRQHNLAEIYLPTGQALLFKTS